MFNNNWYKCLIFVIITDIINAQDALTPVEVHGALSVNGNSIVDSSGDPGGLALALRGII